MRWIVGVALSAFAFAETQADIEAGASQGPLEISGSARAGYFSSSRELDDNDDLGAASLWLKLERRVEANWSLFAEGWIRDDDIGEASDGHSGMLREAYVRTDAGEAAITIGKQIVAWGRADQINPTDNLTPRDYRLLTPQDNDQRFGTTAVSLAYPLSAMTLSLHWLPTFVPNRIPLPTPSGVRYTEASARSDQAAIKLDRSGGNIDWSLSYFHGLDLNPDFALGTHNAGGTDIVLTHNRIRTLGADMATVLGRYGLRAEAAYNWTSDPGGEEPLVKNPFLFAVAGIDRTFLDHFNVNLQYYVRRVSRYRNPNDIVDPQLQAIAAQAAVLAHETERYEHGFTLRLANKWLNETLEADILGIRSVTNDDYAVRPMLVYAMDDHWRLTLGADIYRGPARSFFGFLHENSGAFAEIRYNF